MANSPEQPQRSAGRNRSPAESGPGSGKGQTGEQGGKQDSPDTSPWEWVVAGFSALLVLGVIGFLLYQAFTHPATPPDVTVEPTEIQAVHSGYLVQFRAHNHGYTTAQGLVVQGTLKAGGATVETAEVTVSYLPATGTRAGGLFFRNDPVRYQLEIRPTGYEVP